MSTKPTYEGRPLPRPSEDVEDQGLGFDVETIFARRYMFKAGGLGLIGLGLAACGAKSGSESASSAAASSESTAGTSAASSTAASATTPDATTTDLTEIPDETAGPFPGDGSNGPDALEASGIVRSDITSSFGDASGVAAGVPMTLELNILDIANGGSAFAGVAVYVWHADQNGAYSMYSSGIEDENYLRGVQIADESGTVRFTSIVPACYDGRWPHIHFEVYPDQASITDSANAISTSQVAIPKATCDAVYATSGYEQSVTNMSKVSLESDNVFGDDGGVHQIPTVSGSVADGFALRMTVPVDTRTAPTGGSVLSGGMPGGAAGGTPPGA